jgi:tryptophan 2,3-dioxygenase
MLHYQNYLQLDNILKSQLLESEKNGCVAHDEMLFIITHQTYELWFKQILFELNSVIIMLNQDDVSEETMLLILSRLQRIETIFHLLIQQFKVIETLTPMDFLEFRDHLIPASGFQSLQFRSLAIRLGMHSDITERFFKHLREKDRIVLEEIRNLPQLFTVIDKWLSRTPFVSSKGFLFWKDYLKAIEKALETERKIIREHPLLSEEDKTIQLKQIGINEQYMRETLEENLYNKKGKRLSYKAIISALFITLYRNHPIFHTPYQVLSTVIKIDSLLSTWLQGHIGLVTKVIGNKIGTGGTSGSNYLIKSAEQHRIFVDLMDIPTLIMRRDDLPVLPKNLKNDLGFNYKKISSGD